MLGVFGAIISGIQMYPLASQKKTLTSCSNFFTVVSSVALLLQAKENIRF